MKKLLLICGLWMVSASAVAQVYKCKDANGKTTYSSQKCDGGTRVFGTGQEVGESYFPTVKREMLEETPSNSLANACIDQYRTYLKDPKSAYIQSASFEQITPLGNDSRKPFVEIVVDARAKNSFGAFIPEKFQCPMDTNGDKLNLEKMQIYIQSFKMLSRMPG
ncbi:MAG: DUF4124 domain-containing protein [Oxalobacteraceae bacterium]|nr:DUF4124 domain-containing protein [Oxalobacteraceae bacterium]